MVPQNIKEGIEGHPANWYSDVYDIVFKDLDLQHANDVWKTQLTKSDSSSDKSDDDD